MPRVFLSLACGHVVVLIGVAALGWFDPSSEPARHIALAVFALLLSAFVQVLTFTYFTVTGKVIAQAVHLAKLDSAHLAEVGFLKKSMTRCLACVVLALVVVVATGARYWSLRQSPTWHVAAAALTLLVHMAAYLHEYSLVVRNAELLSRTMTDYRTARTASV